MPRLPVISGDEFVDVMKGAGFERVWTRGSHMIIKNEIGIRLSVPRHKELDRGTLRGLIRTAGLSRDDFIELRR
ncbi:MAG: type II toxin-antitoxin system HicA family toxin [Chloroflexi bacterium]|nr:type II toxin-antitoxin system HicA family toxin [Chloroflexota bacterium]